MRFVFLLLALVVGPVLHARNLLNNPSFEGADGERIADWRWVGGPGNATCTVDGDSARSGDTGLCLKNPTGRKPHVYGTLFQTVSVRPNTRYTLSCYVRTAAGGDAWIGGGRKWEHRFAFPKRTDGWQRVVGSFNTASGDAQFTVRILIESETDGIWVDDIMLEQGGVPSDFVYESPLKVGEARLVVSPLDPGENLVPNPSFEQIDGVRPKGWMWDQRNTDAQLFIETTDMHSGNTCVKFTNGTPFGAHVYGWFGLVGGVTVKPSTSYTLSAFVKTGAASPGAWIGGGRGWKVRRAFPATAGRWERVAKTFTTGEDETSFALMLVTQRPTDGIWLDDVSLREGVRPLPAALEGTVARDTVDLHPATGPNIMYKGRSIATRWAPQRWPSDTWSFCGSEFRAEGIATVANSDAPAALDVALGDGTGTAIVTERADLAAGTQAVFITLRARLEDLAPETLVMSAVLSRNGQTLADHRGALNLVSPERVRDSLIPVAALRDELRPLVEALEERGQGAASRVTLTVLDNFIPWVEADVVAEQIDRAWDAANLLEQMATRELARVRDIAAGRAVDPVVPRYQTGELAVSHAQTIGTRRFPDGRVERGPVFFTGYGHFGQVRRDVEKFPGYGCNFLQIEFGPRSVLPNETEYADRAITDFLAVCDRAAATNVAVNLLLSPHYLPGWAMAKWPHLRECHGGFLKYCVHDPDARAVIEKSLRYVIPRIKDHPALHSLCLSNEPISVDLERCRVAAKAWPAWLERRHGTIAVLNERWGTEYAAFAEIAVPKAEFKASPACLDFIRFNQETFAAFHQWMADVIHEMAPGIPVHAKIMMGAHFRKTLHGFWSVSPELFARLSQYNGNDAYNMYSQDGPLWSNGWRHIQAGYDFQRSMADMPVFNSENHVIRDRDHSVIPPAHLYAELWQNAIHGQSSTTYWVWERTNDHASSITGSILHRPDCVEAVGRCNLDLNRLAHEVAAIQNLAPAIGLLWSPSSIVLGQNHRHHLEVAYEAANFLGLPLGFVTERELAESATSGRLPRPLDTVKVVILPNVTHLPDQARAGLAKLAAQGVRLVGLGEAATRNAYNQPREAVAVEALPGDVDSAALHGAMCTRLADWGLAPRLQVLADGRPVFGVEIRSAAHGQSHVASVCNHLREPRTVTLGGRGDGQIRELISGQTLGRTFTAKPMTPLLLRVK